MIKYLFEKIKNNITIREILKLAWPIISINIFQSIYQLVDTFWVGKMGADAISAISVTFPITFLLTSIISGLTIATSIMIAQYKGKQDEEKIKLISSQVLIIVFFLSIIISVLGYFLSKPLMELTGVNGYVLKYGVYYLRVCIIGLPAVYLFYVFQSIEKGLGNMKKSMTIMVISALLNIVLDPIFIFTFKGGVVGAAIATIISQFISAIFSLYYLYKEDKNMIISLKDLKINKKLLKNLITLGIPPSLEQGLTAIGLFIMTVIVTRFNSTIIASFSLGLRILLLVLIPASGISTAVSILVGHSFGADDMNGVKRITKLGCIISFTILTFFGLIFFLFAYPIASFFINDPIVIKEAGRFIRAISLVFGMLGVQLSIIGAFVGTGNTKLSTTLVVSSLAFILFLGLFLSYTKLAHFGVFLAYPLGDFISLIVIYIIYKKGRWQYKKMIQET